MNPRRARRIKRKRVRRVVAVVTALSALGLGVSLAVPAGASGRGDQNGESGHACDNAHYTRDSYQGRVHSDDTPNSNEGYCF